MGCEEGALGAQRAEVGALEKAHGLLLEERFQTSTDAKELPGPDVARLLQL